MSMTLEEPISDTGGGASDDGGLVSTTWVDYEVDAQQTITETSGDVSTLDGAASGEDGSLATQTSPISRWLETSKWNRQDVELALTATSVFASVVVMILLVTRE